MPKDSSITRAELIKSIADDQYILSDRDVEMAVHCILEHFSQTLEKGERIEIRGFGSFSLHYYPERKGRNPKTGQSIMVPARNRVLFKPSKTVSQRLNA